MQIANKNFIVSGAASGLGAATAQMLIEAGAQVMLVDLNAEAVAAKAQALGSKAHFAVADISQESAAKAAVDAAVAAFGSLHGLINCAGIVGAEKVLGKNGPHGLDSFSRVINVNLIGSFNLLRLAAAAMAEGEAGADGERGVIINTASIAAYDGQIGQAAYAASKGAIASLTLPAARELARFGIRVMTIAPGIFETPMMAGMTQEVRDSLAAGVPFPPRLGRPQEYAALARHIIENSMLNGEVIRLDGALRMAAK
ncbi:MULTISPECIES: SDR family NAD(P)-dependent oxidoreductase [Pseudomonas]|jgi:NAD(P)-dependent dehydrogenase (short-subunit alcohol dehydrogenase family)|uniref:SDR family NAD(P)-dependent oxidoreductase n=1 Tax=Pseudomonas TaxID=286 RepID=UPI000FBC8F7C|nr:MULTISPECIES: SDR family NAD(P)-dependent oxidoreductase [Pseudomonas]MCE5984168.1 SDR family NAD(P)-dependent oxidoreductase [Pseudomonas sp. LF19]UVM23660.1 SDR family NAD(P)-dependent oxidoreductase [Pseudomonas wadenswilerensis]SPO67591.1 putative enzyme [Pseudomonas sp. JV241A]